MCETNTKRNHTVNVLLLLNKQHHITDWILMAHGGRTTEIIKNKNKFIVVVGKKCVWISTAFCKDVVCLNYSIWCNSRCVCMCVCGERFDIACIWAKKKISLLCWLIHTEFRLDYSFAVFFSSHISFSLTLNLTAIKGVLCRSFNFIQAFVIKPPKLRLFLVTWFFFSNLLVDICIPIHSKMWKKVWF